MEEVRKRLYKDNTSEEIVTMYFDVVGERDEGTLGIGERDEIKGGILNSGRLYTI